MKTIHIIILILFLLLVLLNNTTPINEGFEDSSHSVIICKADWCGHCQHFKPDWKKVSNTPARNMPMVAIRDDVFKNSPLNSLVNPEGYPTVALASAANNLSINLPTREPSALTKVVTNANALAPSSNSSNMNMNVNNLINKSPRNNMSMSMTNNYNNNNEDPGEPLSIKKVNSLKVSSPVNRDTIEPPMSEEAYLNENIESENELSENMNQLGGSLFAKLNRFRRAKN